MNVFFSRQHHRFRNMLLALPRWLEVGLLAMVCWQLAGLFWVLFAPETRMVSLIMPREGPPHVVDRDAFLSWFKAEERNTAEFGLVAVIAGERGVAIFKNADGRSVAVRLGGEISPGNRLVAVEPNQISFEHEGVKKVIRLPQKDSQSLVASTQPATSMQKMLPPIRLTRGQMTGILQGDNLGAWSKGLSSAPEGGIQVVDVTRQPMARLLQLNNGDILKSVNLHPLDQLGDISLVFNFFAQQPSVDIVLVRNATTFSQHYDIRP